MLWLAICMISSFSVWIKFLIIDYELININELYTANMFIIKITYFDNSKLVKQI